MILVQCLETIYILDSSTMFRNNLYPWFVILQDLFRYLGLYCKQRCDSLQQVRSTSSANIVTIVTVVNNAAEWEPKQTWKELWRDVNEFNEVRRKHTQDTCNRNVFWKPLAIVAEIKRFLRTRFEKKHYSICTPYTQSLIPFD